MARIREITSPDGLESEQRAIYERIAGGARGGVRGPHTVLLNNPGLASPVEQLGVYVRYGCSVPERLRELAILVVSVRWKADYEWYAHAPLAEKQGYSQDVLAALAAGESPDFDDPADSAVYAYVYEIAFEGRASDAAFAEAERHLGVNGVLDLTGLVGYYTLLAYTLNAFEVDVPEPAVVPWRR